MARLPILIPSLLLGFTILGCPEANDVPDAGPSEPTLDASLPGLPPLQDGGLPKEDMDAGMQRPEAGTRPDGGMSPPPVDAGTPSDAGDLTDAATSDGGDLQDAGAPPVEDAGPLPAECGNGILEEGEVCDGAALSGVDCRGLGLAGGNLACKDTCLDFETSECEALPRVAIAAPGESITLTGTLEITSPSWRRPSEFCGSAAVNRYFFEPFAIVNDSDALQFINLEGSFSGDGYLHVYEPSFRPVSPLTGCIFGNDNFEGDVTKSVLDLLILQPGEELIVVASTAEPNDAIGSFEVVVQTQGGTEPGDTSECGNAILEPGESCDGAEFGGATCQSRGFDDGVLTCSADCLSLIEDGCVRNPVDDATPIATQNESITLQGALEDADGRWTRRNADCSASTSTDQIFETHRIVNQTGAAQYLRITASWGGDGYIFAYRDPFAATTPNSGCIAGDDDFAGINGSQLEDIRIEADEVLVLVASSYASNAAIGAYQLEVETRAPALCGDGEREQDELCDGNDLGNKTCSSMSFEGGSLACSADCQSFNTGNCFAHPEALNIASPGESISLTGSLDDSDPQYRQPTVSCSTGTMDGQYFDTYLIRNQTGEPQSVNLTASWSDDGMLHAYTLYFNSALATLGCLRGGDDYEGILGSRIEALEIANGETLVVVASTYRDTPTGAYSIEVETRAKGERRPIGPPGTSIQLLGSIDDSDPTWNRPFEGCSIAENNGRYYDVHRIINDTGVTADLTITANWQNGDGFIHLVTSYYDFATSDPAECLGGDDDFGSQEARRGSRLASSAASNDDNIYIFPGEELFVVASTFREDDAIGAYSIEVFNGSTDAAPPVPAALAPGGQTLRTYGTLHVTDPRWTIPSICGGPAPEVSGRAVDTHQVVNTTNEIQDVIVTVTWGQGNGTLGIYAADSFAPEEPGLCVGNGSVNGLPGQARAETYLFAGETLTIAASSVDETPLGTYEIAVQTQP